MATISKALFELGVTDFIFSGNHAPETEEEFNAQFRKVIAKDEQGNPTLSDNPADFGVTWAEVQSKWNELIAVKPLNDLRIERNAKLAETDWVITMHKELGTNIPAAWKTYRQALRDITDTYTSLDDVVWPEKPE